MTDQNRRAVLAQRPTGMVDGQVVTMVTAEMPHATTGEAVVRVTHLSIVPATDNPAATVSQLKEWVS